MTNNILRYETDNITLSGALAPVYNNQYGESYHTGMTQKIDQISIERDYGTTSKSWSGENMKRTHRDSYYTFWSTNLSNGNYQFTTIDYRDRMLFNSNWNDWVQNWDSLGELYSVEILLESPVVMTPSVHGAYLMTSNNLNNHTLRGNNLSVTDGTFYQGVEAPRSNGYALRVAGDGVSKQIGAETAVTYNRRYDTNQTSLFCQFKYGNVTSLLSREITLIGVETDTNNQFSIRLNTEGDSSCSIRGYVKNAGTAADIQVAFLDTEIVDSDTWYDVGLTYDQYSDQYHLYYTKTNVTGFIGYMSDATSAREQYSNYRNASVTLPDLDWTKAILIREEDIGTIASASDYVYLQNAFIFDGMMSAPEFNMIRRLCYDWNASTSQEPK